MKVIVGTAGTSAVPEFAGSSWVRLQYMLGFQRLGIETFWVDRIDTIDPHKALRSVDYCVDRFHQMATSFGFEDRYCIIYEGGKQYFGMSERKLMQLLPSVDLLVNISGYLPKNCPLNQIPRRAYVDVDPGFTQMWGLQFSWGRKGHNSFFTVGQNVDSTEFEIPLQGIHWEPILPPVALDYWPVITDGDYRRFSTVADWRASQCAAFNGELYEAKRPEFLRFLNVPLEAKEGIHLALCIGHGDYEDIELLLNHNWELLDPYKHAGNPESYREFIRFSGAEFSVAKHGYVKSNSGWISDRTACYLASGKPALVQSTGFESKIETGKGLLTFRTPEEAIAGIQEIKANYAIHSHAARELAEKYFDSNIVLPKMLEHVGL